MENHPGSQNENAQVSRPIEIEQPPTEPEHIKVSTSAAVERASEPANAWSSFESPQPRREAQLPPARESVKQPGSGWGWSTFESKPATKEMASAPSNIERPRVSSSGWSSFEKPRVKAESPMRANLAHARQVEPDELVRDKGNGGRKVDETYLRNQRAVRDYILNQLTDGDIYMSGEAFEEAIKKAHAIAAAEDVYAKVGEGNYRLNESNIGSFRRKGRMINHRFMQAGEVAKLAEKYNDPYKNRFKNAPAGTKNLGSYVRLEGIDEEDRAYDMVMYGDSGRPNDYMYAYPDAKSIPKYMEGMARLGLAISGRLKDPEADKQNTLHLIARQYQYGAIARPFDQINNSLFMNLANAQIKLLGFEGLTHAEMDIAAQRLQPKAFAAYFVDRVMGREK